MTDGKEKLKALELAITQIQKDYGKGSIMRLGQSAPEVEVPAIPSGSLSLDYALGVWGFPRGRIAEIYGPEMSGKSTLALQVVANTQKLEGVAAFVDAEHALDPHYAKRLGVNLDELLISQPDSGEQALDIVETLTRSNAVDVIIVDSVAALVPRAEIEGEMGDSFVGLQARLLSQAMRKLTAAINRSQTCVMFTNQIREKIGVTFGPSEFTPGGRALKFYATIRVDLRRTASLRDNEGRIFGSHIRARVVKNKIAPPFREAEFDLIHGKGINHQGELIDLGVQLKLVQKSGSWFSYGEERLGQGRDNSCEFLRQQPEISQKLEQQIIETLKKN